MLKQLYHIKFILFSLLFILFSYANAQDNCAIKLKKAQKYYDEGTIEEIPQLIDPCLKKGFSKEEKLQALKLLILCYLYEDNQDLAEKYMLNLLKTAPEYKVNPSIDAAEFIYMFNSFRTSSIFSLGLTGGINYSHIGISEYYGIYNLNEEKGKYSSSGFGIQGGVKLSYHINSDYDVNLQFLFIQNKFDYNFIPNNFINEFAEIDFSETQNRFLIPISGTYYFYENKIISTFVEAGGIIGLLSSSSAKIIRKYMDNSSYNDVTSPDINIKDNRNLTNFGILLGLGAKYKIKKGNFLLNINYNFALTNQVNINNRLLNHEMIFKYYYYDNDFKLNNLMLSITYMYPFYSHKKKKGKSVNELL
ncbi:MAG: hypothetical protein KAT68_16950 [Bacteroidales bacterium]|nr:hypothetical protein [Bacteroidales bacterium]